MSEAQSWLGQEPSPRRKGKYLEWCNRGRACPSLYLLYPLNYTTEHFSISVLLEVASCPLILDLNAVFQRALDLQSEAMADHNIFFILVLKEEDIFGLSA